MNCPHCETEVDEHAANRCLDAWVAEAVLGKKILHGPHPDMWRIAAPNYPFPIPEYSYEIAAAWEVAKLRGLSVIPTRTGWLAGSFDLDQEFLDPNTGIIDGHFSRGYSGATTAPLAICRAALKAVYVGEE